MKYIIGDQDGYLADKEEDMYTLFHIYAQRFETKEEAEQALKNVRYKDMKVIPVSKMNGFYIKEDE